MRFDPILSHEHVLERECNDSYILNFRYECGSEVALLRSSLLIRGEDAFSPGVWKSLQKCSESEGGNIHKRNRRWLQFSRRDGHSTTSMVLHQNQNCGMSASRETNNKFVLWLVWYNASISSEFYRDETQFCSVCLGCKTTSVCGWPHSPTRIQHLNKQLRNRTMTNTRTSPLISGTYLSDHKNHKFATVKYRNNV
jgi:hypothetical protein